MPTPEETLRSEFGAEPGSFLLQLRSRLKWDTGAFRRLTRAMYVVAEKHQTHSSIERWIAEGFWYCDHFVKDWSTHPNFPREHTEEYYGEAYRLLDDLAYFLFRGESPYEDDGLKKRANG